MDNGFLKRTERSVPAYLTGLGAWALAFGCVVGWGAFMMPGTTFLPIAGPAGAALGLGLGAVVMLVIAMNYHYLINRYPEMGGTYAFTRSNFGYDYGFLTAWFLSLTYLAVIWANASALPLVVRILFGDLLRFGFHYVVAGYDVYFGEVLLALLALCLSAAVCLRRSLAVRIQIVMGIALVAGVVICSGAALTGGGAAHSFQPAFSPERSPLSGTLMVLALAPWAYVGFESISHSAEEARFPLKRSFVIMAVALLTGGAVYMLLSLLSVTALPEGAQSWYTAWTSDISTPSQPAFFAAQAALGRTGTVVLGIAAFCAIFTALIGNFIALSRMLRGLAADKLLPGWFGMLDEHYVPRNGILVILAVSAIFPFLGRTAISWIVDVTTVGATIAFAIVSASAWKSARQQKDLLHTVFGVLGVILSVAFSVEFLVPNLTSVQTLSTESYLLLALWGILGFLVLRILIVRESDQRLGRSTVALMVLLSLTIFTSSVWLHQSASNAVEEHINPAATQTEEGEGDIGGTLSRSIILQVGLIVVALAVTMDTVAITRQRDRRREIEQALAKEASQARSSFLFNMSHEIRTPMNAIIGLDSIALRNPNLPTETREQLEQIGESANRLLALMNDMLDMGLVESGKLILREEEFSLQEFLDQINTSISRQCEDKGLRYECIPVGMLQEFYIGDRGKLSRALGNVLGNAVKFTDAPGRVRLTVEQAELSEERCTLRFTVEDTGIGIDNGFLPKIYDAFAQEDITNTSRFGGSGLGLAITKRFLDMMQGTVEADSQKGVGSVFVLTVPLRLPERTAAQEAEDGSLRAAVVDGDQDACEHARLVLESLNVRTDCFHDGWEAVEHIRNAHQRGRSYDLVITDFRLPNLNGLELTRMIRSFDGNKTAIIMLTGYNWDVVSEEALEEGVDSIGAKPLFRDSLQKEIRSILDKKAGIQPAEQTSVDVPLAGHRILIAEDIAQNAEILEDLLALEGMTSEHAPNGRIAAELFEANPPGYYDAILMDVRMPVMDGLSATATIRAMDHPDARTIPIIAMSANAFDEDVQRSLEAGMNAHLTKPVELKLLYATLAEYFALRDHTRG